MMQVGRSNDSSETECAIYIDDWTLTSHNVGRAIEYGAAGTGRVVVLECRGRPRDVVGRRPEEPGDKDDGTTLVGVLGVLTGAGCFGVGVMTRSLTRARRHRCDCADVDEAATVIEQLRRDIAGLPLQIYGSPERCRRSTRGPERSTRGSVGTSDPRQAVSVTPMEGI